MKVVADYLLGTVIVCMCFIMAALSERVDRLVEP